MFLSKAQLEATVEEYDIDVEGLTWPQKQGVVSKYLAAKGLEVVNPKADAPVGNIFNNPIEGQTSIDDVLIDFEVEDDEEELEVEQPPATHLPSDYFNLNTQQVPSTPVASLHIPVPGEPVIVKNKARRVQKELQDDVRDPWLALGLRNKRVMFSPEIITNHYQALRYIEDLGPNATSEDIAYGTDDLDRRGITEGAAGTSNGISGTYKVTEIPGERSTAVSTLPKYGSAIYWDFGPNGQPVTFFPVVEFAGRRGYLYKHATIPSVYHTLFADPAMREHGYYQRFREQLSQEPYIFYLAGILTVDIDFTHYMMQEIEKEEARRNG